jgi:sentrin-specific protease 1
MNQVRSILDRPTTFKSPKCFNEVIEPGNIKRLKTGQWLSDDIMAYYAGLIMKRSAEAEAEKGKLPKIHYFNTFFYTKLASQGYSSLRRWTKKVYHGHGSLSATIEASC